MTKTERTTIYLNSKYKSLLQFMKDETGLSQSELIRRSLVSFKASEQYDQLKQLHSETLLNND